MVARIITVEYNFEINLRNSKQFEKEELKLKKMKMEIFYLCISDNYRL